MSPKFPLGPYPLGLVPDHRPPAFSFAAVPPAELPPNYVVGGRYRIDSTLALQGRKQLYRATDRETGLPVKVKRLLSDRHNDILSWREAEILEAIDHPLLPKGRPMVKESGELYFVQTFLEGPTLRQYFKSRGTLPRPMIRVVLSSVLEALDYLHNLPTPIIHRDIKPANLVVLSDERVGLIDFDIASQGHRRHKKVPLDELTTAHTVGYAPPEQMIGLEAFPSSDLYALAASIIYATTGTHPIHQWNARRGRIVVPRKFGAGLTRLLTWMLEPSLDDRCPSAQAALQQLQRIRFA